MTIGGAGTSVGSPLLPPLLVLLLPFDDELELVEELVLELVDDEDELVTLPLDDDDDETLPLDDEDEATFPLDEDVDETLPLDVLVDDPPEPEPSRWSA